MRTERRQSRSAAAPIRGSSKAARWSYNAKLCINGHEYLKRQLARRAVAFEALDNGIKSCADPKLMQRLTERLSAAKIDHTLSPVLPDVPAMAEVLPGYEFSAWYGLGAPKATPPMSSIC